MMLQAEFTSSIHKIEYLNLRLMLFPLHNLLDFFVLVTVHGRRAAWWCASLWAGCFSALFGPQPGCSRVLQRYPGVIGVLRK